MGLHEVGGLSRWCRVVPGQWRASLRSVEIKWVGVVGWPKLLSEMQGCTVHVRVCDRAQVWTVMDGQGGGPAQA